MLIMNVLKNNTISVQHKIKNKKKQFIRNQLQENTKKPTELWEILKNIGLPSKAVPISKMSLKKTISHNLMTNKMQTLLRTFTQSLQQI